MSGQLQMLLYSRERDEMLARLAAPHVIADAQALCAQFRNASTEYLSTVATKGGLSTLPMAVFSIISEFTSPVFRLGAPIDVLDADMSWRRAYVTGAAFFPADSIEPARRLAVAPGRTPSQARARAPARTTKPASA